MKQTCFLIKGIFMAVLAGSLLLAGSCKKGDQGPPGNANVKTTTITVTNAQWLWSAYYSHSISGGSTILWPARYVDIPVAGITADIVQNGHVLVYFTPSVDAPDTWAPLPYQLLGINNFYYNFAFEYSPGKIRLFYYWTQNIAGALPSGLGTYIIPEYKFKYAVVAGSADKAMKRAGLNVNNLMEVENF